MNRAAGALLACALAGCAPTPPPADSAALVEPAGVTMGTWRKVDAATGRLIDLASLAELAAQFPDSGAVQVRYFNALLRAGDASNAYALLDRISARGYRFSAEGERQINAFFAANGYDKALALTQRPGDAREASALIATVPADIHIVESVLRERASGRLYVTSVASRGLFREDGKGGWERVELGPVGSIAGMVQARDGAIWVASGSYDQTPDPASAFRGFVGLDPASGVIWRMPAPPDATLSDIALGADGALYASDPLTGAIYRGRAGEGSVAVLVPAGTFRSGQGLAASPDGDFLYVSDYGYGLALVDLRSGRVDRVPAPIRCSSTVRTAYFCTKVN